MSGTILRLFFILFSFQLIILDTVMAQPDPELTENYQVKMIAKANQESIFIRWAPNHHILWQFANQYGYKVEKYLILQNGQLLNNSLKLKAPDSLFKPQPLSVWEQYADKDSSNASLFIAAQAIYGNSFEIQTNDPKNRSVLDIVNQSKEQEMRFSYHLISADRSLKVAALSGFFWEDKEVKKGEKYLYKVYANVPSSIVMADTAYVYIGLDDYEPLPKPYELQAEFGNKAVFLTWNHLFQARVYNAYYIERSEDGGKTYKNVSPVPVSNPVTEDSVKKIQPYFYKIDSLPQNNKTYHFRVKGIDSFGEVGPPSDSVFGQGREKLEVYTYLEPPKVSPEGSVLLSWQFPPEKNNLIEGFVMERSDDANGFYLPLHQDTLNPTVRKFEDKVGIGSLYYRIRTIVDKNEQIISLSQMVQLADSIPPVLPQSFNGIVDSTGIATLKWSAPLDKDVMGYRIFRAENANSEFSQITKELVKDTLCQDSVNLNDLNNKVYYKIQVVDNNYNESAISDPITLIRPDTLPPAQPVFVDVYSSDSTIVLQWSRSSSPDVKEHQLYRLKSGTEDWELIAVFPQDTLAIETYTDTTTERGVEYFYTLLAVDMSRLESKPAPAVQARKIDTGIRPAIKGLQVLWSASEKCVIITWGKSVDAKNYMLYKTSADRPITQFKMLEPTEAQYKDKDVKSGNTYRYAIRAYFDKNTQTELSKEVLVVVE